MQLTQTSPQTGHRVIGWRIYGIPLADGAGGSVSSPAGRPDWAESCRRATRLGFDTLSVPLEYLNESAVLRACLDACAAAGLRLMADCPAHESRGDGAGRLEAVFDEWAEHGSNAALLLRGLASLDTRSCRMRLDALRRNGHASVVTVWTPGMTVVVVAGVKCAARLRPAADGTPALPADYWGKAALTLPGGPAVWRDVLRGRTLQAPDGPVAVADLLAGLPLAVLSRNQG